ncbi:MAG: Type IV secretory pathway VirB4 component-like protein [Candidatus Gottesmanbacteria bacterium GW2011_GWA2_41_12]|uniref:Type IV secretory pathway VirB4 component-like protein n=1 Tax=Candidatus Gottesmanbacteria bacterium GW2011_GWA2_41_12 TaxID=1618440 RepID=A0A0G0ULG4_9BACT|nr:MAG: Type IV secretory pathway VirB4 component-like protein [Candidatus Gottesmanbacteria bacterium GW2011_GWA2_41_12]
MAFPFLKNTKTAAQPTPQNVPVQRPGAHPVRPTTPGQVVQAGAHLARGLVSIKDVIAPSLVEVDFDYLKINNNYFKTMFISGYPRFVSANWLYPLISFDHSLFVSMFIYPSESKIILEDLKRKIAEMEATIQTDMKKGKVVDPSVQVSLDDALALQAQLAKGAERFFQFGLYVTVPGDSLEELNQVSKQVESTLGSLLIIPKHATLQMEEGFKTTLPYGEDKLNIPRNMDTTSLATTFPFTTASLTANQGILYGINEHDGSLVIFDRFSLENANAVIFGKSGGGKSFFVKLETLRSLMFGTEVFVIDPEGEYDTLAQALGGERIDFSFNSPVKINPFDLSGIAEEGENELGLKILSLHSLMRVIMGELSPAEDAILDRALVLTYRQKGITPDPATQKLEPPLMEDLYKALLGMEEEEAKRLAERLEKFIKGSLAGIFNQKSNLNLQNQLIIFNIKELEAELRPIAMFIILDFIWSKVKKTLKKRILIVDEAWYLMKYQDSANFLYGLAKRARKYYLGVTTITQDVEDFLSSPNGKAIITNSSIQILLKQSTAAIDKLTEVFYLSSGEKHFLLSTQVGEGLFFAGQSHVAIRIVASQDEYTLVSSKPEDVLSKQSLETPAPAPAGI